MFDLIYLFKFYRYATYGVDSGTFFVYWARKRAAQRSYSINLSLQLESFQLYWKGISGVNFIFIYPGYVKVGPHLLFWSFI